MEGQSTSSVVSIRARRGTGDTRAHARWAVLTEEQLDLALVRLFHGAIEWSLAEKLLLLEVVDLAFRGDDR